MESTSTTPDLPVTQPTGSGALAYPQGLPVGMSALDEMDGSGGFNPLGLIHSLRRQLLPAIGIGIVVSIALGAVLWFLIPVKYTADAVLRVNRELSDGNSADYMIYKETQGALLRSVFVVQSALRDNEVNQLPMVKNDGWGRTRKRPVAWLSGAIRVVPDESELIAVSLSGRHKEQTQNILNKVIEAYTEEIINKERLEKVETLAKLRKRYTQIYDQIRKKTDELTQLAKNLGSTDDRVVAQQLNLKISQMNNSQRELERLRILYSEAVDQFNLLQVEGQIGATTNPSEYQIMDELEKDRRYSEITMLIEQYKDEVEQLSSFVRSNSAQMQQYQTEIARLERKRENMAAEMRPRIIARIKLQAGVSPGELQRQAQLLRQRIANYEGQIVRAKQRYDEKFAEVEQYGGTSGEIEARMYDLVALRTDMGTVRTDMQMLEGELDGPERVTMIQPATISKDSNWKAKLIQVFGGCLIAFCGTIGAVAYWDYLGKRVNGEEDISRSIRVVGALPEIQRGRHDVEEAMKLSIDAIRTAILYNRERTTQCVLITSATGEEGRSTVASQLAVSMARAGKTTLIIDGDLRNPQQHVVFSVQPYGGLSEMLRGEQTSDQAIVATAVENVWLLSAGRCDQAALQGLSGDQARATFEDFRDRFDMIIIDASPVLTSADALLLGQFADAAILSVRRDVSQMPKVNAAADRLASVGIPMLGAVVNGSNVEMRGGDSNLADDQTNDEEEQPALTNAE